VSITCGRNSRTARTSGAAASASGVSAKQPSGSGGFGSPSGRPGVDEAEEALLHAEDLPGPRHLLAPDPGHVGLDLGAVHGRVQDVAALPAGQRAHQDLGALAT
jgi:hypothetical protein